MDFETLLHGNFSSLVTAIDDWSSMVKNLKIMERNAQDDLKEKAEKANWAGVNANVSRDFIRKTAGEFRDARIQASTIYNILKDTRDELVRYQDELKEAIEQGRQRNIAVSTRSGDGGFTVTLRPNPDSRGHGSESASQLAVDNLRDDIQRILNKAHKSDTSAARVLSKIADQAKYGFSGAAYRDRDTAANALKKASDLAKLAKNPEEMSLKEISAFNRDMKKYRSDPLFSEHFATTLGANNTLQFWTEITAAHSGTQDRSDVAMLKDLQRNMSMTLAAATHSDSAAMQQWERGIIREGNTSFRADPTTTPVGVSGFQVMSSLMGHGKYDSGFLGNYGEELLKKDKSHSLGATQTKEIWGDGDGADLVFGKGNGIDPLIGFMDGLSHNPEASEQIFSKRSDLDHILESTKNTGRGDSVGHALEAAVMGIPYGEEAQGGLMPHSKTQTEIVKNVMHAVADPAGGADLVGKGIGDSFGHIAAAYMPEINRVIAGPGMESVFPVNSSVSEMLDRTDTYRFLYALARDDDAAAGVIYGRDIYTNSTIEAHLATEGANGRQTTEKAIEGVAYNAGVIDSVLSRSRADAEIQPIVDGRNDFNESLKTQGDFLKSIASTGIAVGAASLEGAGDLSRKFMLGAGGAFLAGAASLGIDRILESREMDDATDHVLYRTGKDISVDEDDTKRSILEAAEYSREQHDSEIPKRDLDVLIAQQATKGWVDGDSRLDDNMKRPN
ncbi:hypothetical protein [Streptomyces cavernicola]|uniref:WXG100 family type VII secretion target n=1 Tax=Streptomyces cavernicola TaxID=3043613 RepID=A0ABT6SHK5_9ACTN|nr:hypothetical protein [Streptomyces sp. B-S-A6]MDI3407653.1 hypothetical protein [Streptomyces sp. B-S-A6]